jgi:hypothetical protein
MRDLACAVHVHSTYSDGTATVPEILAAARTAHADAVLLSDHDTLAARRDGWEGWHDGVLLVVGMEISPKGGHFLAFGLDEEVGHEGRSEEEICAAVAAAGGLGFPAHPFSEGSAISTAIGRPHPWRTLESCDATGIELWSVMTECAERCASLRELVSFMRRPEDAIDAPPPRNLERWDVLCRRRRVVAVGGLDAHQSGVRLRGRALSPHPHDRIFRTLRTHVLTSDDPGPENVCEALREGRCYLAVDSVAPAQGFRFSAESDGTRIHMGAQAPAGRWTLRARLPEEADVTLIRNGVAIRRERGDALEHVADEPGVFRVEALRGDRTWILSNPIYLR